MGTAPETTFVLVPGAWLGAWSWHPVARVLREHGHRALTVTVPGLSYGSSPVGLRLRDAVDHVVGEVVDRDLTNVVLVGHSWGGYPVTGAAHRLADRVRHVVYYNAVVPERGVSMAEENEAYGALIRESIAATSDGTVPLTLDAVRYGLLQGEPEEMHELVFGLTLPQPGRYMTDALEVPSVTEAGLDASYVLGTDDTSLARPGTEFAARLGVEPHMVPGGHMALLNHPEDIATALLKLL
ncbi:alpha/beta fold hydrolase [Streptomyces sp. NPDC093065]|uniref:alpha/beta fold hydrolase n=1 Tax=Streptomyces sp. NPDC093065 TaxID=3366021 RepID=UPI003801B337